MFVSSALLNSIGRLDAPFMTLPFNFIAIVSFLSFQTDEFNASNESSSINASMNGRKVNSNPYHSFNSMNYLSTFCSEASVDWLRVVEGSVLSMGQVYAVQVR